jgi:hypothetical protein
VDRFVVWCFVKDLQRCYPSGWVLADNAKTMLSGTPLPVHT